MGPEPLPVVRQPVERGADETEGFARTGGGFEETDGLVLERAIDGMHKLALDGVGRVGEGGEIAPGWEPGWGGAAGEKEEQSA